METLLGKRPAIERAIGFPLEEMLGCGHWGCVFRSTDPWVVKLSIDPTEGPIWSKIGGVLADEVYGDKGLVEVKSITRILPDIVVGGKKRKIWAIVREGVEPVFREFSLKELGERGRGTVMRTSSFTNDVLRFPRPLGQLDGYVTRGTPPQKDFVAALVGLYKYRDLATIWHMLGEKRKTHYWHERFVAITHRANLWSEEHLQKEAIEERMTRIIDVSFHGPYMAPLGESLGVLANNGIYLRDVHNMNIGWHKEHSEDDWTRVVIFDPGHTPTDAADIESVLVENPREAL